VYTGIINSLNKFISRVHLAFIGHVFHVVDTVQPKRPRSGERGGQFSMLYDIMAQSSARELFI
jgi:hypothetical protein